MQFINCFGCRAITVEMDPDNILQFSSIKKKRDTLVVPVLL